MVTFISNSEADTVALGIEWGKEAGPGWVFGLTGPLGAGKTRLVRGIAQGLDVKSRVRSPTFTLVHEYTGGKWPLFHIDLYRVETIDQFESAGLDQYLFAPEGVTVIEWFDHWPAGERGPMPTSPGHRIRRVAIQVLNENARRIMYEDSCT
ncbi:MAG TPA: tRNA (adenosine(37)-N6)-threonylcarbamoyltransferase complex ATPase subunit type 1 TsaE [Verrucomicrobiota bacterium]|nr:tRNA (adenosine(37)-N6)-threonylcarbamoyltransferase complex ATPase subunit type 1 TsaE [Verrucomicrobiota bacterium]